MKKCLKPLQVLPMIRDALDLMNITGYLLDLSMDATDSSV